jgi:transposase
MCPQVRLSGGKVQSSRVRRGSNRAAVALRLAARSLHHSKSALGAFFRRMKSRLGSPKAIVATAHKLTRLVYRLLKHGEAYVAQGMEEHERKYQEQRARSLARQARELGFELVAAGGES